mgnify:CR=1 FL=1
MVGWIWEVLLHLITHGTFVNRGTMFGPWLPIYGYGGVALLILLKDIRKRQDIYFILSMIIAGVIEFTTSWYLEVFNHLRWWDYRGYFLNINGRICFEGLLVFGLGSLAITYFFAPLLNNL